MWLIVVVGGSAVIAAGVGFTVSMSRRVAVDPIDPTLEERALRRALARHPRIRRFLDERVDRATAGGFMLTAAFALVFGVALGLGVILQLANHSDWLAHADRSVSEWGSTHASSGAVTLVKAVTQIGATPVVMTYLALAAAYDYIRRRNIAVFGFVAAVGIGELLLNNGIKMLVRRDRPSVLHLVGAHGYSFPSGHSCAAAAATSAVALLLGRDRSRRTRATLAGVAALAAVGVATSRALLGVHWVSDVLAGLMLGWGWFLLVAVVFGGRRQRVGDPSTAPRRSRRPSI